MGPKQSTNEENNIQKTGKQDSVVHTTTKTTNTTSDSSKDLKLVIII